MNTWYEYRDVWSTHWWVLALGVFAAVVVVVAAVATVAGGPFALLFIPGLAGLYGHHLLVKKIAESD